MSDVHILANAFRPAHEMDDPHLFAGRSEQVSELVQSLHSDGACPIIYGDRGLGKTSLAVQAERIARGDTELLHAYDKLEWCFDEASSFVTAYFTCSDDTRSFSDLVRRLINLLLADDSGGARAGKAQLIDKTRRVRFSVKVFEAEDLRKYAPAVEPTLRSLRDEEVLVEVIERIVARTGRPLLIVIDELDRVEDTAGLASFIKAHSSTSVKFLLVGIAQSVSNLLADHLSIERTGVPVRVPPMSEQELAWIIRRAVTYLRSNSSQAIGFTGDATRRLASLAAGFPWFVHVIGQDALIYAHEEARSFVTVGDIEGSILKLNNNRFAQRFADRYQQAVQGSEKREMVLRVLAQWPTYDLPLSELNSVLKASLEIRDPGYYRRQLSTEQYGNVLMDHPFHKNGVARFCDEMFKVYVRLRPSIVTGVDYLVEDAWRQFRRSDIASRRTLLPEEALHLQLYARRQHGP